MSPTSARATIIEAVTEKAYETGASKVIVEDLREEFVTRLRFAAIKAGAVYEHKYLLGTSLARPVIAKYQVECALREGATAVSHGCTGKGNDQVRFEHAFQALAPELKVIAPWREWTLVSREDCLDYAEAHGIPVAQSREKIHSRDRNLLHISHEGGELEDPNNAPLATTWQWTKSPQEAPDRVEQVEIGFEQGEPVSVNGQKLDPVALVDLLNEIGARNAIGRVDLVENRFVGMKSRGCYETPGGTLLLTAHRELEVAVPRSRCDALQAARGAEVCGADLLRTVVHAVARVARCVRRRHAEGSNRHGETGPVQREHRHCGPQVAKFALQHGHRELHDGRGLRSEGCGRIHPHHGAARTFARAASRRGSKVMKMWSGRFSQALDPEFEQWQRSFPYDKRLLPQEVAASKAHALALKNAQVLTADELAAVLGGLDQILREGIPAVPTIQQSRTYTISSRSD